jgi:hypothetical protein
MFFMEYARAQSRRDDRDDVLFETDRTKTPWQWFTLRSRKNQIQDDQGKLVQELAGLGSERVFSRLRGLRRLNTFFTA